jgi:adenylylsulfate kinase-like enzyme
MPRPVRGEVKDFTGISAPFEAPLKPSALRLATADRTAAQASSSRTVPVT